MLVLAASAWLVFAGRAVEAVVATGDSSNVRQAATAAPTGTVKLKRNGQVKTASSNTNSNDNDGGNDNGNGNDAEFDTSPLPREHIASIEPEEPFRSICAPAGRETRLYSADGRVSIRVGPSAGRDVGLGIRMPVDVSSAPVPSYRTVDTLLFELVWEGCGAQATAALPVEANLDVTYAVSDVGSLLPERFAIAYYRADLRRWEDVTNQVNRPERQYTGATTANAGFYVLYQR
ncbi:MAG: hypothetical protein U0821_07130 [Chloroflexota bacterium]